MGIRANSVKNQILISFLPVIGVFLFAIAGAMLLLYQANRVKSFRDQLVAIESNFEMILIEELIFLQSEYNDFEFHKSGKNERLDDIRSGYDHLNRTIDNLTKHGWLKSFDNKESLSEYQNMIEKHQEMFNTLVANVKKRGVKDYGLIGEMRGYIHYVEEHRRNLELSEVLFLRRHEKDFLLRNQRIYIDLLNVKANQLLKDLKAKNLENSKEYKHLVSYQTAFNNLVQVIDVIGNFKQDGLRYELEETISGIKTFSDKMLKETEGKEKQLLLNIYFSFYAVLIFSLFASVILSFVLAKYRSQPLIKFSKALKNQSSELNIQRVRGSSIKGASNELRMLIRSYNMLVNRIKGQLAIIQEQNKLLTHSNEKLTKVNKELDNFVYRVSHDLRAPLSSILGITLLNKLAKNPDELRSNNDLVEISVRKMDTFIIDIINLSRNSRTELQIEKIELQSMLEEIVEHHKFMKQNHKLEVKIKLDIKENFYSDRHRLNVVFSNLIGNAFKYSDTRKARQMLKIYGSVDSESLSLHFEDNGVGIPEKYVSKIFDMFFRASYNSHGSGLGLYITRETLDKLNGSIEVESVEGMLSIFKLHVPNVINETEGTLSIVERKEQFEGC
ncbi:MAG: HAMP domain-containing histidine kinase [Cyclobacteriaceae bacterium]|nr:HAMP domain-containing histidine kinase [Cyclobacteriaceae bacterium]